MWCCTDAVILGQMYEKQDPEKRKGSCVKIAYFFFLYVVIIVFSCLGYDYYGRSSNRGMPWPRSRIWSSTVYGLSRHRREAPTQASGSSR